MTRRELIDKLGLEIVTDEEMEKLIGGTITLEAYASCLDRGYSPQECIEMNRK